MCSPSNRTALATRAIWWGATENAPRAGFISANSYFSTDGARVVNYAQWRSAEASLAMLASAGPASARGRMRPVGERLRPHRYAVESVRTSNHFSGSDQ